MKHRCLSGSPSEPCQRYQWKCLCGYGSPSAAPEAQLRSPFWEMPPPSHSAAPALEEVGEGADKGNCCPQSSAGETSTRQKGEQAPICDLSHVTVPWPKALMELGTRLHTCAPSHGNAPAPARAVPQKQGYRITQVRSLFPFPNFYSAEVMHFRESIKFD